MMEFSELKGKTLNQAVNVNNEKIKFEDSEGRKYELLHWRECCESVYIESIVGDLEDLIGSPLLVAECYQWTFYKLATIKGSVTIRFYGSSNGYYSTGVDFEEVK